MDRAILDDQEFTESVLNSQFQCVDLIRVYQTPHTPLHRAQHPILLPNTCSVSSQLR